MGKIFPVAACMPFYDALKCTGSFVWILSGQGLCAVARPGACLLLLHIAPTVWQMSDPEYPAQLFISDFVSKLKMTLKPTIAEIVDFEARKFQDC